MSSQLPNQPTPLQQKLRQLEGSIHYMKQALPYADGQQFYDDKKRIAELESELTYWRKFAQYDQAA